VDYRTQQREHATIDRAAVERVKSFKFLKWFPHTDSVIKKAQQHNYNLTKSILCLCFISDPADPFSSL
jgi:hypothetical protein